MTTKMIRLLIADDNKDLTGILKSILSQKSDIVIAGVAHTGQEARSLIQQKKIDVVLLDIIMPGMDGLQFLADLNEKSGDKPAVIVLSAIGSNDIIKKVLDLGADSFLLKPVDVQTILYRIRSAFKNKENGGNIRML